VNNVVFVQWMQDAAVNHARITGCTALTVARGATWVVRSHRIEYLQPVYQGDSLQVLTWVADFRRIRSLRQYRFLRAGDNSLVARGETDWVFVDAVTGRPRPIPPEVAACFDLCPPDHEP
jgi:acyl-CoA thioester hydrolase